MKLAENTNYFLYIGISIPKNGTFVSMFRNSYEITPHVNSSFKFDGFYKPDN